MRRQDVDGGLVGVERRFIGLGDLGGGLRLEARRDEHAILPAIEALVAKVAHVRDVLDVDHFQAVVEQDAPDEIGQQVAPQVADMSVAIDRRPTGVHANPPRLERHDRLDAAGQRVAKAKGHRGIRLMPES